MNIKHDFQAKLRRKANQILRRLSRPEREELLIKCWMSHDARWFMAVAREYGLKAANKLNQLAAHEIGKVEAQRITRALQLPPVKTLEDWLLIQEGFISLLGPDLLGYSVNKVGDNSYQIHVQRCFAYENALRAGIADQYDCGIFARLTGWLEALDLLYETNPALGRCLMVQGQHCRYTIGLKLNKKRAGMVEGAPA